MCYIYAMRDETETKTHPSYGMARFDRVQGNPGKLFGSVAPNQGSFIRLTICAGELVHSHGQDRYFQDIGRCHINVDFSAAQFAELLTNLNYGNGVPCTVRMVNNEYVENPPDNFDTEIDRIRSGYKAESGAMEARIKDSVKEIKKIASTLSPARKSELSIALEQLTRVLLSDRDWALRSVEDAADRVVAASKAEIEAFLTHTILQAGLQSLLQKEGDESPPLLSSGEPVDK